MSYIVEPLCFPTLSQEHAFTQAIEQLTTEPALESFFSVFASKESARTMPKFDREKLKNQSLGTLEKVLRNLTISLDNWRHEFHNLFNDSLKYIMNFNKEDLKLCNADLKRLSKRQAELKRYLHNRGISPEQRKNYEDELLMLDGKLEELSKRIKAMSVSLVLPEQMGTALNRVMHDAAMTFRIFYAAYDKYEHCLDALNDPKDLRYGTMKLEKLALEMESIADSISPGHEIRSLVEEQTQAIQRIVMTDIYNQSPDPLPGASIEIATNDVVGRPLIQTYDKAMLLLSKTKKRIKELSEYVSDTKKGDTPAPPIPLTMIVNEIVFNMTFFNLMGDLMTVYFSAPLSIAKAKATK